MSLWKMLAREIAYRRIGTLIGLLGITLAAASLVGVLLSLEMHAARSEAIVRQKQSETRAAMQALEADVRSAMHRLGFNAVILPADQQLSDWYAEDYAQQLMPQTLPDRLAETEGLVDRYLPRLRQKLDWKEKRWTVIVIGVGREQVLDQSVCSAPALAETIAPGQCIVGHELHRAGGLDEDDTIRLRGQEFVVAECRAESGTKDDITIWLALGDAQELVGLPGKINEILIVEHLSVWGRAGEVQQRLDRVLPDCQVVEFASETLSRAHARVEIAEQAEAAVQQERSRRAALQAERDRVAGAFVPLGILAGALWIAIQMSLNVRDRSQEIGVLMAQGFRGRTVRTLILTKAALQGMAGGSCGFVLGAFAAASWETRAGVTALGFRTALLYFALSVVFSAAACLLGSWLPASLAVRTDPAVVLRQES